jgi:hypothetical protein
VISDEMSNEFSVHKKLRLTWFCMLYKKNCCFTLKGFFLFKEHDYNIYTCVILNLSISNKGELPPELTICGKTETNGLSEQQLVEAFLKEEIFQQDLVVWPPTSDQTHRSGSHWKIIITEKTLLWGLATHGKEIIGLDSVYKFTKYGFPTWLVVFCHAVHHEGVTAVICPANSSTAEILSPFL